MHCVSWPVSVLFNVLLWCVVFLSCRGSPSKNHNLAKNKTKKKTAANSSSPFCCFALPFQLPRPGCFAIIIIAIIIFISAFFIGTPFWLFQRSHEIEACRVFFFYGVWGHAPASEVSAASWRCECIRVCLICGITAEGLCRGKRWREGRYKPANIVFATSSPPTLHFPLTPALKNSSTRPFITPEPGVSFSAITCGGKETVSYLLRTEFFSCQFLSFFSLKGLQLVFLFIMFHQRL